MRRPDKQCATSCALYELKSMARQTTQAGVSCARVPSVQTEDYNLSVSVVDFFYVIYS